MVPVGDTRQQNLLEVGDNLVEGAAQFGWARWQCPTDVAGFHARENRMVVRAQVRGDPVGELERVAPELVRSHVAGLAAEGPIIFRRLRHTQARTP